MIDPTQIIARQLSITQPESFALSDGRSTQLTPVREECPIANDFYKLPLDGVWKVKRWPFSKPEDKLVAPRAADRDWEHVIQPGKVFSFDVTKTADDIPKWDRIGLTHLDPEDGAIMRKAVFVPREWSSLRIMLRLDSIYPAGRIYVNGQLVGEHLSGLTPAEYDVTDLIKTDKENLIAVRLLRRHAFVRMDMPRHASEFAGLAQSACLFAVEPVRIAHHRLQADLDHTLKVGTLSGELNLVNNLTLDSKGHVLVEVLDGDQAVSRQKVKFEIKAGQHQSLPIQLTVKSPKLWNDEFPNLYTVRMSVCPLHSPQHQIVFRSGFRRFEFKDGRPLLNGHPVKFRGVNHLSYHPQHGLHTPEPWLRQCLQLMKKANVNCIRTHYLGPRILAELCDELGIYLIQELPIDWGTNYIHDVAWVGPALHRIMAGVMRDRRHPSVMVWSVGNENMPESAQVADEGWHHLRLYETFVKQLDPQRPCMFPPPGPANSVKGIFELRVGDIADIHYSFQLIESFKREGKVVNPRDWTMTMETNTREDALKRGWSGVWFSSEYGIQNCMPDLLHAPYTSIITDTPEDPMSHRSTMEVFTDRLRREWGLMRSDPSCLGGAYFPWICGAAGNNPWGWVVWAEDNDWGPVTADLMPKPFFWAMRVLFSPVQFPSRLAWQGEDELQLEIENQYNAIDLKDCTIRTMMGWGLSVGGMRWRDVKCQCPPGHKATLKIPLWNPEAKKSLDANHVTLVRIFLIDPQGFRPLTHDLLVVPPKIAKDDPKLLIGPDVIPT